LRVTPTVAIATLLAISAFGCSDPNAPTAVSNDTAPADLSVQTDATPRTVTLSPGQNIQAAVNSHPAGTTFILRPGTYRNQRVIPKSGDAFIGQRGVVLDGGNSAPFAFDMGNRPFASNVRIEGLTIQNYRPSKQHGAINAGTPGRYANLQSTGWVVRNCEIRYNSGAGLTIGHRMQVLNNYIHHNLQIGVRGLGDGVLVENNEIAFNNYRRGAWGWEAGGTKFVRTHNLVVRGNYVHDNWGPGLWTDIDNINTLIEGNRVTNNAAQGIFHEISYAAVIRNNVATGNGMAHADWLWGSGILVAASADVEVYGNTVSGNANGITGIQQKRGTGAYGAHLVKNLNVHDNVVTMTSGGQTGIVQDMRDNTVFTSRNNRFSRNTYANVGNIATPFAWMNGNRTISQWKGYGQDVTGIFR
jgi:parallel beta-helix repeat protein